MKIEAMLIVKTKAAQLLKVARESRIYQQYQVSFLEEPAASPNHSKIVIDSNSWVLAGLAQAFLVSTLDRLNKMN